MSRLKNYVAICIDESGSMSWLRDKAKQVFRQMVQTIKDNDKKHNQDSFITLIQFGSKANLGLINRPVSEVSGELSYYPSGNTALWDSVGLAVNTLDSLLTDEDGALVMVITDGGENSSAHYTDATINTLMKKKLKQGNYTFTFQVPQSGRDLLVNRFGVDADCVQPWEQTEEGLDYVGQSNSLGLTNYAVSRSSGQTSVKGFYKDLDLTNLKSREVKAELYDLASQFHVLNVSRETQIRDFVEAQVGTTYRKGCAAYQLSKKEMIQSYKEIFVRECGKKEIYGGGAARKLLGIKEGVNTKVCPKNLANFEIFIISTSVNRKLVPGTKLLVKK